MAPRSARIILDDPELRAPLAGRGRGDARPHPRSRARLAASDPRLAYIDGQNGMFSMLPLTTEQVLELRERARHLHGRLGRFNVVGLADDNVDRFAAAVVEKLDG